MTTAIAQPPIPAEAFEQHPEKWVAIRDGKILAVADTHDELVNDDRVDQDTDILFHVPSSTTLYY